MLVALLEVEAHVLRANDRGAVLATGDVLADATEVTGAWPWRTGSSASHREARFGMNAEDLGGVVTEDEGSYRKLPRQADNLKLEFRATISLGMYVSGGTWPRLS